MITWNSLIFPNRNSPIIEQIIMFHDNSIIVLFIIIFLISYIITNNMTNKITNRYILERQSTEIIWTLFPAILLSLIALPSIRLLYLIEEDFKPSITIKIIGHQWYWSYEYTDFKIKFNAFILPFSIDETPKFRLLDTDNRLIIPFNIYTRLLITSIDVIHAWALPSIGLKIDAVPGRINQINTISNQPGLYFGQCSEICGTNHRFIPITLEVTSIINFIKWIKNK